MKELTFDKRKIVTLMKQELRFFFYTPVAYIFVCVFLILMGVFFFFIGKFFVVNQLDMRAFFEYLPVVLSVVIPLITMAMFSEEFRSGSYEILNTFPVEITEIVLAKFLATTLFLSAALVPTLFYPLSLSFLGDLALAPILGSYFGAVLLIASFSAIGIFASSLTRNQIVAFISAFSICITLSFLIHVSLPLLPGFLNRFFGSLSAWNHFSNIARGLLDLRDIIYFLSITVIALLSAKLVLEQRK